MTLVYVGTSGWNYFWNKGRNLSWYIENTGFNAVELNMSFYRFPIPTLPKYWSRIGSSLAWSIKVNRLITHRMRFSERSIDVWKRFRRLFEPMERKGLIHFYLFQCPPSLRPTQKTIENIERFVMHAELGENMALEFRNNEWFRPKWEEWGENLGITLVSVDAPDFRGVILRTSDRIYVRLHGRTEWYHHLYTRKEMMEILQKIRGKLNGVQAIYFFLNNNHGMLPTGELIIETIQKHIPNLVFRRPESRIASLY